MRGRPRRQACVKEKQGNQLRMFYFVKYLCTFGGGGYTAAVTNDWKKSAGQGGAVGWGVVEWGVLVVTHAIYIDP